MLFNRKNITFLLFGISIVFPIFADTQEFYITLQDHVFTPSELIIPANTKVKLIITNKDSTIEEFDSFELNREKVLFPGRKGRIYIGPLPPGKYEYFGEYFPNTARGSILVEPTNAD